MDKVTRDSKPVRVDDVVYFPHDGETLLHHLDSGQHYRLNPTASEIWELCEGVLSVADIADRLVDVFETDLDEVIEDVLSQVREFHDEECVVLA